MSSILSQCTVPDPRPLPVILLLDASGSMLNNGKINLLNRAVSEMIDTFANEHDSQSEIQVTVVTFSREESRVHQPLTPAKEIEWNDISAGGKTPLGDAFQRLTQMLEDKTVFPDQGYAPTIVLVSDGIPTDEWEVPLENLLTSPRALKAQRIAMGIGADADFEFLKKFVDNPEIPVFHAGEAREIHPFIKAVTMIVLERSTSSNPDEIPPSIKFDEFNA